MGIKFSKKVNNDENSTIKSRNKGIQKAYTNVAANVSSIDSFNTEKFIRTKENNLPITMNTRESKTSELLPLQEKSLSVPSKEKVITTSFI